MRSIRKAAPLAIVAALALGVTSCAESDRDGGEGGEGGSGGTFTFGAAGAPEMFDPLYATDGVTFRVTRQMFEGLLDIEPGSATVEPGLATEWTANEDGTVWDFTLRDDVTFHDGTPFNAEAVCANFERMFNQNEAGQVAAEYWGYVMGGFANDPASSLYKSCEVTDEFTARVTITRATSDAKLAPVFDAPGAPTVVCGHTHMQFDRQVGATRVVNAGSVGMPFGSPGAYWLLIDGSIQLRRTEYDLAAAVAVIRGSRYPQAESFASGNVLNPPGEAQMIEAFGRAELQAADGRR